MAYREFRRDVIEWGIIPLWCCRCNAQFSVTRDRLNELDRLSEVVLCAECKVAEESK